jgi:N-acetylglutamate synthase-like GNAT family acetyltransferase
MSEEIALRRINRMTLFVAIDQKDNIIGTIGWKNIDEKEGHIRGMAVHPNYQGKKSPATKLLQMVEEDARSRGVSFLTLDTTAPLKRAQDFYKKHGFRETGKRGNFFGITIYEFVKEI